MKTYRKLDGETLEVMLRSALNHLRNNEKRINKMNVFPVPDGDTGSNMRLTLENGINSAKSDRHFGRYLKEVSKGMLMGARGNSGVILSQLFKGLAIELEDDSIVNVKELRNAYIKSYKVAYNAVTKPIEGTILTIARQPIETIKNMIDSDMSIEKFYSVLISEMRRTLLITPELLPELKEAHVLDSGGEGYIIITEGMSKALYGEKIELKEGNGDNEPTVNVIDTKNFKEDSEFTLGYCMEFILQLLNSKNGIERFERDEFINEIKEYGNSIVCVKDESRVKVHIHTLTPYKIMEIALGYGEFVTFKLENMEIQHNEIEGSKIIHKPLGKIGIVNGKGLTELYKELGCDIIIDGGSTMNTSSEEILDAIKRIDAERIVIFQNNKNIEFAAKQAVSLSGLDNVTIIKTKNSLEGYYSIAMDIPENENLDYRIKLMKDGAKAISTSSFFRADRDCTINGIEMKKNDSVSLHESNVVASSKDLSETIMKTLNKMDLTDKYSLIILKGNDFSLDEDELRDMVNEKYPDLEVSYLDGGQKLFEAIIGVI